MKGHGIKAPSLVEQRIEKCARYLRVYGDNARHHAEEDRFHASEEQWRLAEDRLGLYRMFVAARKMKEEPCQ